MREVNRKVLVIAVACLAVAMLTTPIIGTVMADPTQGQKVPIVIHFSNQVVTIIEERITDGIIHRVAEVTYDIAIDIDSVPTYTGIAYAMRNAHIVPKEGGGDLLLRDDYVMSIDGEDGTFEGQAVIMMKGWFGPPPTYDKGKAHALLMGTGVFEGQTINAGHNWVPAGPIVWTGYLLKP